MIKFAEGHPGGMSFITCNAVYMELSTPYAIGKRSSWNTENESDRNRPAYVGDRYGYDYPMDKINSNRNDKDWMATVYRAVWYSGPSNSTRSIASPHSF